MLPDGGGSSRPQCGLHTLPHSQARLCHGTNVCIEGLPLLLVVVVVVVVYVSCVLMPRVYLCCCRHLCAEIACTLGSLLLAHLWVKGCVGGEKSTSFCVCVCVTCTICDGMRECVCRH